MIGLSELSFIAGQISAIAITRPTEIHVVVALAYFLLCFGLSLLGRRLEIRLARAPRAEAA